MPAPLFEPDAAGMMESLEFLTWAQSRLLDDEENDKFVLQGRDEVLSRFGPIFRGEEGPIEIGEILEFIKFENNHHWTGMARQKGSLSKSGDAVVKAVKGLGQVSPIESPVRAFDAAVKAAKGLGKGIVSAILFVAFPEHYAVWNETTDEALTILGLMPVFERKQSVGEQYEHINGVIFHVRSRLNRDLHSGDAPVDFWTIDYYWYAIVRWQNEGRLTALVTEFRNREE